MQSNGRILETWTTTQLIDVVKNSTTYDGRIAPDYAESYKLADVISELALRSMKWDAIVNHHDSHKRRCCKS
jgi:hypothetical protein